MDNETAGMLIDKVTEIFNAGAVKTLGDLAEQMELPQRENLPEEIRAHSLSPNEFSMTPNGYIYLMKKAGFEADAVSQLVEAAYNFKEHNMR